MILIPGGLTGWISWEPHQVRLADSYRVIRVQPIHNELGSAGVPGDLSYSADVEIESLRMTLELLGIDEMALAGWSRGGGTALEYALEHQSQVRSLTLIEPEAPWVLGGVESSHSGLGPEDEAFVEGIAGHSVSEDDLARFLTIFGLARDPAQARAHPAWSSWVEHRNTLSWPFQESADPDRSIDDLERIQCPVLLVMGTDSAPRDRAMVTALDTLLPDARLLELDGGHASHIESIDHFLEAFASLA